MKAMICEMCNSNDLVKDGDFFVCQHCGTKYTVEAAKKLMGTVTIDHSSELENLFILARRARNDYNYENAEKYYSMITQMLPNNWEAAFFQVYYRAIQIKLKEISNAAIMVENSIESTCVLIVGIADQEEQLNALYTFLEYAVHISNFFASWAKDHFDKFAGVEGVLGECSRWIVASGNILSTLEQGIKAYFPANTAAVLYVQKEYSKFLSAYGGFYDKKFKNDNFNRLNNEILAKDPSYVAPKQPGGCYVATAVYGSYDCPEVWTLRRYRDNTLAGTWYGRAFIRTYYAVSPTLVKWFGNTNWFKNMWKPTLDKMVAKLNNNGVEDTPYNDRKW